MHTTQHILKTIFLVTLTTNLIACGGDSVEQNKTTHTTTNKQTNKKTPSTNQINKPIIQPNDNKTIVVTGDTDSQQGKMTSLIAYHPEKIVKEYQWQQLSGKQVKLSSYHQGLVTFRPQEIGLYEFMVTLITEDEQQYTKTITINVSPSTTKTTELLRDRAVTGNRNFIMNVSNAINKDNLVLEVKDNSKYKLVANLDKKTGEVYVRSIQSNKSQLVKILVKDNYQVLDTAYVLIEGSHNSVSPYFCNSSGAYCATSETLGRTFVYNPNSPYRDVLQKCTFSNQLKRNQLCTIQTLPPLGYINSQVSLNHIKDRLIVGEEWMGDRFMDFMKNMDNHNDLKTLFGSATAIIISDNIQVPFYWALTGAIYLSPYDLYLNEKEFLSVAKPYDYHQYIARGESTAFIWQYLQGDRSIAVDIKAQRNLQDIYYNFSALLYHELSHANDFYPNYKLINFDKNKTMLDNLGTVSQMTSNKLKSTYPLKSNKLKNFASHKFNGRTVGSETINTPPSILAKEFFAEGANDLYNYTNEKEDMAMLFEEVMMKYRFNIDRHISILDQSNNSIIANKKNRVFDKNVLPRTQMVIKDILPQISSNFAASLLKLKNKE